MPAFTRYISLSAYKDENLAWFKEHDKELNDLRFLDKGNQTGILKHAVLL
jgi:hypothetical protein